MLKILLHDICSCVGRNSIGNILNDAYIHRTLPINKLIKYSELEKLPGSHSNKLSKFNLFIMYLKKFDEQHIEILEEIRKCKTMFVLFIAENSIDLSKYVIPGIRTATILYSPIDKHLLYKRLTSIYKEILKINDSNNYFKVKNGSNYIIVNTKNIYYFESLEKKMIVKTNKQEIAFYSNFNSVLEQLPNNFIRCHKGFVVNMFKVAEVQFNNMQLLLMDENCIPVSRKYKDDIKKFI